MELWHSPFWWYLGLVNLALVVLMNLEVAWGNRQVLRLGDIAPAEDDLPSISILIAARNEARNIEEALRSVLLLDYPRREIVVVDDRSTDETGAILDRIAGEHPELRVVHLTTLPEGWIGKNYALHEGARHAKGQLILFTDGDVVMKPDSLRRAVAFMRRQGLDHLAVLPRTVISNWLLDLCVGTFALSFATYMKPWKARDPKSRSFIGVGGFNLFRREVYDKIGGHHAVRMRPDEDVKLGKLVKGAGYRQDLAFGHELISVEWYRNFPEFFRGLEKNMFAGTDYRLWIFFGSVAFFLLFFILPPFALLFTRGATRVTYGLVLLGFALAYWDNAGFHRLRRHLGWLFPLGATLYLLTYCNSTMKTLANGGIYWRETFYPIKLLKKNKI